MQLKDHQVDKIMLIRDFYITITLLRNDNKFFHNKNGGGYRKYAEEEGMKCN